MRLTTFLLAFLFLAACTPAASPPAGEVEINRVPRPYPQDLRQWANAHKMTHHATEKVFEGKRYILVSYGEKATGGYTISVKKIVIGKDKITVTVEHSDPAPGDIVIHALTYPQDLVWIENLDLPVESVAIGAQDSIGKE